MCTHKQENFCLEYAKHGNASKAYRTAYNTKNMKDTTIETNASELLKHSKVSVRLKELTQKKQKIAEKEFSYTIKESFKNHVRAQEIALSRLPGKEDLQAYIKAEIEKAKLVGLYIKDNEQKSGNFNAILEKAKEIRERTENGEDD